MSEYCGKPMYGEFYLQFDGMEVDYDGIKWKVEAKPFWASWPYEHYKVNAVLVPKSKNSKRYKEEKRKMGDDFVIELESVFEEVSNQFAL